MTEIYFSSDKQLSKAPKFTEKCSFKDAKRPTLVSPIWPAMYNI